MISDEIVKASMTDTPNFMRSIEMTKNATVGDQQNHLNNFVQMQLI